MNRHTITFGSSIEAGVRKVQIYLMKKRKSDVPFTEAVNYLLLEGLWVWAQANLSDEENEIWVEHWMADTYNTIVPGFKDSLADWKKNNNPKFPSRRSDKWFTKTKNQLTD